MELGIKYVIRHKHYGYSNVAPNGISYWLYDAKKARLFDTWQEAEEVYGHLINVNRYCSSALTVEEIEV